MKTKRTLIALILCAALLFTIGCAAAPTMSSMQAEATRSSTSENPFIPFVSIRTIAIDEYPSRTFDFDSTIATTPHKHECG